MIKRVYIFNYLLKLSILAVTGKSCKKVSVRADYNGTLIMIKTSETPIHVEL